MKLHAPVDDLGGGGKGAKNDEGPGSVAESVDPCEGREFEDVGGGIGGRGFAFEDGTVADDWKSEKSSSSSSNETADACAGCDGGGGAIIGRGGGTVLLL